MAASIGSISALSVPSTLQPTFRLDALPDDVLPTIFEKVTRYKLESLANTSRALNQNVVREISYKEFLPARQFIDSLLQKIPEATFATQRELLVQLRLEFSKFTGLVGIKKFLIEAKGLFAEILKTCDYQTLNSLKTQMQRSTFESSILERTIDIKFRDDNRLICSISNSLDQKDAYREFAETLISANELCKAGIVFRNNFAESDQKAAFSRLFEIAMKGDKVDDAIRLTGVFPPHIIGVVENAFEQIIEALIKSKKFSAAAEMANQILNGDMRAQCREAAFAAAMADCNLDEAMWTAVYFTDESRKGEAFQQVAQGFMDIKQFSRAADVSRQIPDVNKRDAFIEVIFAKVMGANDLGGAFHVIRSFADAAKKATHFAILADAYAQNGEFAKSDYARKQIAKYGS